MRVKIKAISYFLRAENLVARGLPKYIVVKVKKNRVEAGSNTSTVTLRVVRGDEKGEKKKAAP
jgi:hypothetical protein